MNDDPVIANLFRRMGPPEIPAELREDGFLDRIYEHAAAAEERALGPILDAALSPMAAPEDASWQEVAEDPAVGAQVTTVIAEPPATPHLLWTRIREDMQDQRRAHLRAHLRGHRFQRVRRVAAVLLVGVGLFGLLRFAGFSPADLSLGDFSLDDGTRDTGSSVSHLEPVFRRDPGLLIDDDFLGR